MYGPTLLDTLRGRCFRRIPAYPARLIADPRVKASHSSSLIRMRSTREGRRWWGSPFRQVYLGHLRRFMTWCGGGRARLPEDPGGQGQAYILELIERRDISKSYQNQVVSALRFLCWSVLGQPKLALRIPRPRKEHALPAVLSPDEVARMIKGTRNTKHRALLMLLYSAGAESVGQPGVSSGCA